MKKSVDFIIMLVIVLSTVPAFSQGIFEKTADWGVRGMEKVPGSVEVSGSGTDAVYTMKGNGDDIWDNEDEGFFIYKELSGSWSLQAKVQWIDNGGGNDWAKIGVMIREKGDLPQSKNYWILLRGAQKGDRTDVHWRDTEGGSSNNQEIRTPEDQPAANPGQPMWLRVTRVAPQNLFYSEYSFDGKLWLVAHSQTIPMPDTVAYGLAITNHMDNTLLAQAEVSNVVISEANITSIPPTPTPRPMATPTLPASSNTVITAGSVMAKPGETILIPISIVKSPSVDAFQFEVEFDSKILTYQSVSKEGSLSKDFILVDGNALEPGKVRIAGSAFTAPPFSGDGVIVNVVFKIDAAATDGETPLSLSNLKDDILGAKTVSGKVAISTFVSGDVNGDGAVTAGDAQLAFEFAIGKKTPTGAQIKAGDVDGNSEITAGDAQKIFYLSIGKSAKTRIRQSASILPSTAQKLAAGSVSAMPGDEIWVPIAVQGADNVLAFTFELLYDAAALEFLSVKKADSLSSQFLLVEGNVVSSGRAKIGGAAFSAPAASGDGTLVWIGFKVRPAASGAFVLTLESLRDDIAAAAVEAGQILVGMENTPTPTRTATPISLPTVTPLPVTSDLQPLKRFTLDSFSEFTDLPGGFLNPPAPGGSVSIGKIPNDDGDMSDGVGAVLKADAGQLELLMFPAIDVGDNTALIRVSVRSNGPGAAIGLAALDGSFDGSLSTNIPSNSAIFQDEYKRMTLLYDPPGTSIVPIFQVSNLSGTQTIQVDLDNYEIYLIPKEGTVPAPLLNGQSYR